MIYCFNNYLNDLNKIKKEKWWEIEVLSKKFKTIQGSDNFDEMKLREELLRGIYGYGFDKPSAIQQKAIIPCIKGIFIEQNDEFFKLISLEN